MGRRGKKYRKSSHRCRGDAPGSNKENSFNTVFCSKAKIHNFRRKTAEPATRSYQFDTRTLESRKHMDREELADKHSKCVQKKNKSPDKDWFESNRNLNFPSTKISSIAFFIPLNKGISHDPTSYTIDLSDMLFYESNNAALILRYQFEQNQRSSESTGNEIHSPLGLKYRSTSESSATSEDSVVVFENDDELSEESHALDTMNSTSQSTDQKFENVSDLSEPSCSCVEPSQQQRKKVRFVDNTELVTVHLIVAWNYAYRAARISPWEVVARDSNRFRSKIHSLESILNPVLTPEHREKIWETRMREHTENALK